MSAGARMSDVYADVTQVPRETIAAGRAARRAVSESVRSAAESVRSATVNVRDAAESVRDATVNVRGAAQSVRSATVSVRGATDVFTDVAAAAAEGVSAAVDDARGVGRGGDGNSGVGGVRTSYGRDVVIDTFERVRIAFFFLVPCFCSFIAFLCFFVLHHLFLFLGTAFWFLGTSLYTLCAVQTAIFSGIFTLRIYIFLG